MIESAFLKSKSRGAGVEREGANFRLRFNRGPHRIRLRSSPTWTSHRVRRGLFLPEEDNSFHHQSLQLCAFRCSSLFTQGNETIVSKNSNLGLKSTLLFIWRRKISYPLLPPLPGAGCFFFLVSAFSLSLTVIQCLVRSLVHASLVHILRANLLGLGSLQNRSWGQPCFLLILILEVILNVMSSAFLANSQD